MAAWAVFALAWAPVVILAWAPAFALAAPPSSGPGSSVIYTCRDASGRLISSDRLVAECSRVPVREMGASGTVKREIAAPLTPEQARQRAIEEERRRTQEAAQRRSRNRDRALLNAYADRDALEVARQRALSEIDDQIASARGRIGRLEEERTAARATADSLVGKPQFAAVDLRARSLAASIQSEQDLIDRLALEQKRVSERFDADAERLQALLGKPAGAVRTAGN